MSEKAFFFDSIEYTSWDFAQSISSLFTNGVIINNENLLSVSGHGSEMKTLIETGRAIINGRMYFNNSLQEKIHSNPDPTYNRIDLVVLRLNINLSKITVEVLEGTPSEIPSSPPILQDTQVYEMPLAKILITAGKSYIESSQVTDLRQYVTNAQKVIEEGTIMMWAGSVNDVPNGWALCDGTNGTPNLVDRFILATNNDSKLLGGSETHILTTNELPSHNHTGLAALGGSHTHSGSTSSDGSHSHQHRRYDGSNTGFITSTRIEIKGNVYYKYAGTHSHPITLSTSGEHNHSATINVSGGGEPFEILPKYYKLAFIAKL